MTVPFWCLAIACILPYVWVFAVAPTRLKMGFDNRNPRAQQAQLTGLAARGHGAHLNAFEALAVFAPAVLVAHLAGADPVWSTRLALAWTGARVLHGVFYLADQATLRSAVWFVGLGAALGLFGLAAMAG